MNHDLQDLRASLDNLDNALVYLLSERFRITEKVGQYKKIQGLPPVDPAREAAQLERIEHMALQTGLNPEIARKVQRLLMDEVARRHKEIAES